DGAEWSAAASLARDLDATEAFAAGLRLTPTGRRLADELGLPVAASVDTLLRARSAVPPAEGMERLARTPGTAAKLRLLGREIVPSPEFIRAWWPPARRGRLWLAAGYARRPVWLAVKVVPATRAWRRARHDAERSGA